MNTFRILLENTFKFKEAKLYLMLLRENNVFGVEVVDREKTFGRKYTSDRSQANLLFDEMTAALSKCTSLPDAEKMIKNAFTHKSIDKILFILMTDGKTLSQRDIGILSKKIHFRISMKTGFKKDVKDENSLTIYIYENIKSKKPFGVLVGDARGKKLTFELL